MSLHPVVRDKEAYWSLLALRISKLIEQLQPEDAKQTIQQTLGSLEPVEYLSLPKAEWGVNLVQSSQELRNEVNNRLRGKKFPLRLKENPHLLKSLKQESLGDLLEQVIQGKTEL